MCKGERGRNGRGKGHYIDRVVSGLDQLLGLDQHPYEDPMVWPSESPVHGAKNYFQLSSLHQQGRAQLTCFLFLYVGLTNFWPLGSRYKPLTVSWYTLQ